MPVEFNHTLITCSDKRTSSDFMATMLGLPEPQPFGIFFCVETDNGVSLDFIESGGQPVNPQHYAFLITEAEFDEIFARIQQQGLDYWADPFRQKPGEINRNDDGRGVYFPDPDGHLLEVLTRPYGSGGSTGAARPTTS